MNEADSLMDRIVERLSRGVARRTSRRGLFGLLGALVAFRWRRYAPPIWQFRLEHAALSLGWLALFAIATEITQMATLSRSASPQDVWIDLWGVAGGIPIGLLGYQLSGWLGREGRINS